MLIADVNPDIKGYETKIFGLFTKRQLVCLLIALAIITPAVFLLPIEKIEIRVFVAILIGMPAIICGFWSMYGMPVEKYISIVIRTKFISPAVRRYEREPDPFGLSVQTHSRKERKVTRTKRYAEEK